MRTSLCALLALRGATWVIKWGDERSVVTAGIFARMIDALHPHPRNRLAGTTQDVAAGYGKAQILGQPRHLIGSDRLLHLPPQGRVALHPREEKPELLERHRRLSAEIQPMAAAETVTPIAINPPDPFGAPP